MDSRVLKFLIDVANGLVNIADKVGLLNVAVAARIAKTAFKSNRFGVLNWYTNKKNKTTISPTATQNSAESKAQDLDTAATERNTAATNANIEAEQRSVQASSNSAAADNAEAQASANAAAADSAEAMASNTEATADAAETASSTASMTADIAEAEASIQAAAADGAEQVASEGAAAADAAEATASNMAAAGDAAEGASAGIHMLAGGLKAGSTAFKLFNAAATMGISLLAGFAIEKLFLPRLYDFIYGTEKAAEAAEEAIKKYSSTQDSLQKQKSTIDELASAYKQLSKGVDLSTNKNINLSTSSYQRYLDVCNDIADMYPNLVTGFDAQGNAILSLKGNVDALTEAYKEAAQANRQQLIAGRGDIFSTFKNDYDSYATLWDDTTGLKQQLQIAKEFQVAINSGSKDTMQEVYDKYFGPNNFSEDAANMFEAAGLSASKIAPFELFKGRVVDVEAFEQASSVLNSFITSTESKIKTAANNVKTLMDAYLGENEQYTQLDQSTKSTINTIVSNLSAEFINGFESADDLWTWIDTNIVNAFSDNNLGAEISKELSDAFNIQSNFKNNKIALSEYKEEILSFVDDIRKSGLGKEVQDQILQMFDINLDIDNSIGSEIDQMLNYAESVFADKESIQEEINRIYAKGFNISPEYADLDGLYAARDDLQNLLGTLSYSDLQIINSDAFNVSPGTILSWSQLLEKIKETRVALTQDFTTDNFADYAESISSISTNISTLQEALEKLESGQLTLTDYIELIQKFPALAKGVDASSKKFKGLSKNLKQMIRNSPDDLVDELKQLKEQLVEAGKSTDYIDQLIDSIENMPTDAVKELANEYVTLSDQINEATQAQNELKDAMSENPNEGYETRSDAIEQMKTLMEKGEIGSESALWDIAEAFGFTYESSKTIQENADALYEFIKAREKWYATDKNGEPTYNGTKSFASTLGKVVNGDNETGQKLRDLGMKWDFDGKQLDFDFDNANWDEIIGLLSQTDELAGLTSEEFYDLLMQVGQFFDINWQDADDLIWLLDQINDGSESVSESFDSAKNAVQSFLESNGISLDWLDKKVEDLDGNGVIDITESEEFKALPDDIQEVLTKYYELKEALSEDPLGINWQLDHNSGETLDKKSLESLSQLTTIVQDNTSGAVFIDYAHLKTAAKEAGYTEEAIDKIIEKIKEYNDVCGIETSNDDPLGLVGIKDDAEKTTQYLTALQIKFAEIQNGDNTISYKVEAESVVDALIKQGWTPEQIQSYLTTLEQSGSYSFTIDGAEVKLSTDDAQQKLTSLIEEKQAMSDGETTKYTVTGTGEASVDHIKDMWDSMPRIKSTYYTVYENTIKKTRDVEVNGTAHAHGTAFKSGSWGAPKTTEALTGELGPELRVRGNEWTLVGQNGAEFTDVRRGDVIFNHKQTEDLLKNGYVTGRGKAYAQGTAFASGSGSFKKYEFSDTASKLSKAAKDVSKASDKLSDDFKELFDWIEVRVEEITERIDLMSAKLENAIGSSKQNAIINDMISMNRELYDNLTEGASKYYEFSAQLLEKIPAEYREAAKNGAIAIESFTGKVSESTLEAIQDYREWVQKGADLTQQAEETLTEISNLAKQAIDNIASDYENKISIPNSKIDQYDAYNSLLETDVGYESEKIYQAIIAENNKNITTLQKQRNEMQAELNKQVEAGNIKKYSQDWYDAVNAIAEVDTQIIELRTDTEDYQDAINELHWDKFDDLMSRLEAVSDEAENLIDILSSKDLVNKDTGEWTKEGITTLGLYAQKMEAAEVQAKKYEEEIKYLNKNWKKLGYTEQEYVEKLEDLKSSQYDAIKAYEDTKDAIVDLNKERVDAIKNGIEKEIDAYQELIDKKKKELDAEKDLYSFQKDVKKQQKDIADIQRKLLALAGDNSASARAQRAKLQAELAEAQAELEDTYYERGVEKQQEALDKELENFQNAKQDELDGWDEYLENTNQVVSDSLATIQSNTDVVYQTLKSMGKEYGLSITESLTSPWQEGENAIQSFSEKFGISMSATVEELEALEIKFKETMLEIEQSGIKAVNTVKESAEKYQQATQQNPPASSSGTGSGGSGSSGSSGGGSSSGGGVSYPYGKASETSGNIKKGAKGNGVKAIQYALNQLGYGNSGTSKVDGIFGSGTQSAVKAFQKAMGISADGIVGKNTRAKFKLKGYASGTAGVKKDQLALIDELGEELVINVQDGKLKYLSKGSGVVPADFTSNLMDWGAINPQDMLDRNRPSTGVAPSIINNNVEFKIDASVGTLLKIDEFNGDDPDEVLKMINKALDQHTKNLNNALKRYSR